MSRIAIDLPLNLLPTYTYPGGYDSTKLGLGPLMLQRANDVGPVQVGQANPNHDTGGQFGMTDALSWSSTVDWIFIADTSAASPTRVIAFYTFDRTTATFTYKGFITCTYPINGNHTIVGQEVHYTLHTAGTVAVNGTAVTGTSTSWQTDRACVGNRIGFGSTDPTQISTWYEISAIGSDGGLTLTGSAGVIGAGSAYVIEDLRILHITTNSTAVQGGLFVTKGLRFENFTGGGTTISAAVSTDNARAVYWLADASTVTNTVGAGLASQPITDKQTHYVWTLDGTGNPVLFKYNARKNLTLSSGKDTTSLVFKTGTAILVTGSIQQTDNLTYAVANHGPFVGVGCLYFTTVSRFYCTIPVANIFSGIVSWLGGWGLDNPPGTANTYSTSLGFSHCRYLPLIDRFWLASSTLSRPYVTQFKTDLAQLDRGYGANDLYTPQTTSSANAYPHYIWQVATYWDATNGIVYGTTVSTPEPFSHLWAIPIGFDWEYAGSSAGSVGGGSGCRIVTPAISTPYAKQYLRAYVSHSDIQGGATGTNLGFPSEAIRMYYRTTGISDNSGLWIPVPDNGGLNGAVADQIQFMFEFRAISAWCVPPRMYACGIVYDDLTTDIHYQPSATFSSGANKQFAWRFTTAFGGSVPALRIRIYGVATGMLLVDDNTASPTGTWERSTNDGGAWSAWNNTDLSGSQTYLRYTPASFGDNVEVRAFLTLN